MAQDFAKPFYNSKAWQACRESYIVSVFGLCERCIKEGRAVPGVIVHHKVTLTPENINDPDITLNHRLLELLCIECHNRETFEKYETTREDVMFDEDGQLVSR